MNASEEFKMLREKTGLTVREFCKKCDIGKTSYQLYSDGSNDLRDIRVETALQMFDIFGVDIEQFYDKHFHFKEEMDNAIHDWNMKHPRNYNYKDLKLKFVNRLSTMKKRLDPADKVLEEIKSYQIEVFKVVKTADGLISEDDYQRYILDLSYRIRKLQTKREEQKPLYDAMLHTDYSITDLSDIMNLSRIHLRRIMIDTDHLAKMKIISYLRLCYVLNVNPQKCFDEYSIQ